jgi:uncharacterized protein
MISRRLVLTAPVFLSLPTHAEEPLAPWIGKLVEAGEGQIGVTTVYDPAYIRLAFPNGDPPIERGVCTDVIIRAYRAAFAFDHQKAVNADMKAAFSRYPKRWGLKTTDRNIDHRRVPNLQVFWTRKGAALPIPAKLDAWQAGDIATMMLPGNLPHVGIIGKDRAANGEPLMIHNIGRGTQNEIVLSAFTITGRFRFSPEMF